MQGIEPNTEEKAAAEWLQKLFDFETEIDFLLYDFSKDGSGRHCTVSIQAVGEEPPRVNSSTDDYGRGPNSKTLAQFARHKLPKGEGQWYSMGMGFYIPFKRILELKERMETQS